MKFLFFSIISFILLTSIFLFFFNKPTHKIIINPTQTPTAPESEMVTLGQPEISGWIAWWIEDDGYAVVEKHHQEIFSVSPGWFSLDKNYDLVEIGEIDKNAFSQKSKTYPLKLYPMLVTELSGQELADFINNTESLDHFIQELLSKMETYDVDGIDLDFENIDIAHKKEFSFFIKALSNELRKKGLHFSVTIQAQAGKNDWNGMLGQDIALIGKEADEVRIMIYDRHGEFSEPGPITPIDWFQDVISYNMQKIPQEKIVIALPTYGYLWLEDGTFKSFQYKDFISYMQDKNYDSRRDPKSLEIKYTDGGSIGFLSDAMAVNQKMNYARNKGLNRFAIWNFSGTDEKIFEKEWEEIEVPIYKKP